MPISLGRSFIEWKIPAACKGLDRGLADFSFVNEIQFGADHDDGNSLVVDQGLVEIDEAKHTTSPPLIR